MDAYSLLAEKLNGRRTRQYPGGQVVLRQADSLLEVLALTAGVVKVYDVDDQGNEKVLQLMSAGAILPLDFPLGKHSAVRWYYGALTDCEAYALPVDELLDYMQADSMLTFELMRWVANENYQLLARLSSLGRSTAKDKIEAALRVLSAYHADQNSKGPWRRVNFPVNHQLLADMAGITRERTTATMKVLQRDKISRSPKQTVLEVNIRKLSNDSSHAAPAA